MALHASAQVPLTRPSHISLFTGLYPAEHGIRDNVSPPLRKDVPVLAEILQQRGFKTGGFVSSIVLSKQSGLGRGFSHYADKFEIGEDDARFLNTIQKRGDTTVGEATAWLAEPGPERRFAWVHLYDPHDPYEPPEPFASRYAGRLYDGEVAWSDELVGRLDAALAAAGLVDDTLLIVTSDHGEGLEEHGEAVHGFFVYETTLHVPLIVRGPGIVPGTRLNALARTIDVMPTALDLLGLGDSTPHVSGRSLKAALNGAAIDEEPAFAESLVPLIHYGWSDLRTVRDGRWKYILAPRPELYDLVSRSWRADESRRPRAPARPRPSRWNGAAPPKGGVGTARRRRDQRDGVPGLARKTRRPRICEPDRFVHAQSIGCRSEGQNRRVSNAQHADARRADRPARGTLCRQPLAFPETVRPGDRQLRSTLLRRPRAGRPETLARGRGSLRARARKAAGIHRRLSRPRRSAHGRREGQSGARRAGARPEGVTGRSPAD